MIISENHLTAQLRPATDYSTKIEYFTYELDAADIRESTAENIVTSLSSQTFVVFFKVNEYFQELQKYVQLSTSNAIEWFSGLLFRFHSEADNSSIKGEKLFK